jgi:hypothetical protein
MRKLVTLLVSVVALLQCYADDPFPINNAQDEVAWIKKKSEKPVQTKPVTAAGEWGAIGAFGEIGPRNVRGSATYGVYFTPSSRFKVSGEYLHQQLDFHFHSGQEKKWVSQYAIGGEYQYLTKSSQVPSVEIGTAYNHAFSHQLKSKIEPTSSHKRRIAGSNSSLSFIGGTIKLWDCSSLALELDYDWVHLNRHYQHHKDISGFGGSVRFTQLFAKDFSFNLDAELRQPFSSYQGALSWNPVFSSIQMNCGVFGNLTYGNRGIRTIRTVGFQLGFAFGPQVKGCGRSPALSNHGSECYSRQYCSLTQWVSTPAVYVPVVLTAKDEKITAINVNGCDISSTNPGTQFLSNGNNNLTLPPTYIHSSLPVTYSFTQNGDPGAGNLLAFDTVTGVLTAFYGNDTNAVVTVTITATSACGTTSQTFEVHYNVP